MSQIIPFRPKPAAPQDSSPQTDHEVPRAVTLALGAILLTGGPVRLREICRTGGLHRTCALIDIESAGLFRTRPTRLTLTGTRIDLRVTPDQIDMPLRVAAVLAWASACDELPVIS